MIDMPRGRGKYTRFMGRVNSQREALKKNQEETLETPNNVTQKKAASVLFIGRLGVAEEATRELAERSIETSKGVTQREKG